MLSENVLFFLEINFGTVFFLDFLNKLNFGRHFYKGILYFFLMCECCILTIILCNA